MAGHIQNKRKGFLSGVSVLTLSALLVKIIGLLYRIPLLGYLGTEGMGYFNTAYELYALFCVISTAGLPVAMSVLISGAGQDGVSPRIRRIFRVSLTAFVCVGAVGSLILFSFSEHLAGLLKNDNASRALRMISPTVFFICLSGAFRGYFQGRRDMVPTAVSQVIEAGGKLLLGLLFAAVAVSRGADLPTVAAAAVAGLTVGTAVSVVYLWVHKSLSDRKLCLIGSEGEPVSDRHILRSLLTTALPITLSAGVISLTKCIDLALILRRLQATGMSASSANALYGCYSTLAVPVFNILPSLTTSVALSAVPALSAALGKGDREEVHRTARSAFKLTLWIAIPAALGLSVFSGDVLSLLFSGQPEAVSMATPWLSCLALAVPSSCLITVTGAMLQAAGHAERPVISMIFGALAKIVLAYVLLGHPSVGLMGAPISSVVCDAVIVVMNLLFLTKYAPDMLLHGREASGLFFVPLVLATLSVGCVMLARCMLGWSEITPLHTLGTITVVMCLYGAGMLPVLVRERRGERREASSHTPSKFLNENN